MGRQGAVPLDPTRGGALGTRPLSKGVWGSRPQRVQGRALAFLED